MNDITVTSKKKTSQGWQFVVETPAETEHAVTLTKNYYQKLTGGDISPEVLVKKSLAFLLDKEPANAILSAFHLKDIEDYFPGFAQTAKSFTQSAQ